MVYFPKEQIMNQLTQLKQARDILISPSLLAADFTDLRGELLKVESADALHLDIMDGHFVPNISYGPGLVKQLRPLWPKLMDVHLMVSQPELWLDPFCEAGADIFVFHIEATNHAHRLVQEIHQRGVLAGISLNPATPAVAVKELIPYLDLILVMTVNPGFGGQAYISEQENKIRELRQMITDSKRDILLQVDGGISEANIAGASQAGADFFVAGTAIFKAPDPQATIQALRQKAKA